MYVTYKNKGGSLACTDTHKQALLEGSFLCFFIARANEFSKKTVSEQLCIAVCVYVLKTVCMCLGLCTYVCKGLRVGHRYIHTYIDT